MPKKKIIKKDTYTVVREPELNDFIKSVQSNILKGYQPCGGVIKTVGNFNDPSMYIQAMTLISSPSDQS